MPAAIEVVKVTKRYGRTVAVDDLSFVVQSQRVTGFVGPNGAGKSTTMRVIVGLDAPDSGIARVLGSQYRSFEAPMRRVGTLLDAAAIHPGRRARAHLRWLAQSNGLPVARVEEVLGLVGLSEAADRRVGAFSLGMRQRLALAAAMLGDPEVLMLDEPVNGLDPDGIRWIRGFLRDLASQGRTVFVSSHLMSELEDTADHLVVIGRGRLLADVGVAQLLAGAPEGGVRIRTPEPERAGQVLAAAGGQIAGTGADSMLVTGLTAEQVAGLAAAHVLVLVELTPVRRSLEDAYLELTGDAVEHPTGGGTPT